MCLTKHTFQLSYLCFLKSPLSQICFSNTCLVSCFCFSSLDRNNEQPLRIPYKIVTSKLCEHTNTSVLNLKMFLCPSICTHINIITYRKSEIKQEAFSFKKFLFKKKMKSYSKTAYFMHGLFLQLFAFIKLLTVRFQDGFSGPFKLLLTAYIHSLCLSEVTDCLMLHKHFSTDQL